MEKKKNSSTGVVIGKIITFLLCGFIGYFVAGYLPEKNSKDDSHQTNKEIETITVQGKQSPSDTIRTIVERENTKKMHPRDTIRPRIINNSKPIENKAKKGYYSFTVQSNLDDSLELDYKLFLVGKFKNNIVDTIPQPMALNHNGEYKNIEGLKVGHQYYVQVNVKNDTARASTKELVKGFPYKPQLDKKPSLEEIQKGICLKEGFGDWRQKYCTNGISVTCVSNADGSKEKYEIVYVNNRIAIRKWKNIEVVSAGYEDNNKVSYIELKYEE